jgi:hypothetical protein
VTILSEEVFPRMELRFILLLHIINRIVFIKNMRLYTRPGERKEKIGITGRVIIRENRYMDVITPIFFDAVFDKLRSTLASKMHVKMNKIGGGRLSTLRCIRSRLTYNDSYVVSSFNTEPLTMCYHAELTAT